MVGYKTDTTVKDALDDIYETIGGGGGSSLTDRVEALETGKQDKLTAGSNISFSGNTINAVDEKVKQSRDTSDTAYPMLLAGTTNPNGTAQNAKYTTFITANPNDKSIMLQGVGVAQTPIERTTITPTGITLQMNEANLETGAGVVSKTGTLTATNYSGTSAQATADGNGNNIVNTYATKAALDALTQKWTGQFVVLKSTGDTAQQYTALNNILAAIAAGQTPATADLAKLDLGYIYLLENGSGTNVYDEYIKVATGTSTYSVEKIGTTDADGQDGTDGVGIVSITKTSTSGLVDTYTITLTNGQTYNFNVTNGKDGEDAQPPYFVNLTWDNSTQKYTADKTPEECQNAYEAGQMVIFRDRGTYQSVNTFEWLMSTSQYYPQPNLRMVFAYRIEGKDNDGNLRISQLHYRSQIVTTLTVTTITAQQLLESGVNIKTINSTSLLGSGNISVVSQAELANYCPIIEDTRSSAVAAITGVAPFASLVDGQRIVLQAKYNIPNNATLTLTLSNGNVTSDIPLVESRKNTIDRLWANEVRAGSYIEFIYSESGNMWTMLGQADSNTTYASLSQANVNTAVTSTGVVSGKLIHDNAYIVEEAYSSGSLKANKFYDFGTVSSALTIPSLDATNDLVSNALNFYALRFIAGADNLSITFPTGVIVDDTPTINTGDYVEIMINLYVENNTNHFYASIKVWQAQ